MIKVLELFSGIGAVRKAMENQNVHHKVVGISEIDKSAIAAYCALYNEEANKINLGDITKITKEQIENLGDIDFIEHGSPCQDFSVQGRGAGGGKYSGTRSSLYWNSLDIIKWAKPKYVLWENVKNLVSKKFKHNHNEYLEELENLGYRNYWKILNAKDFGVAQNRERVFTVSIRNDVENDFQFIIPNKKITLEEQLDFTKKVDDKYYYDFKKWIVKGYEGKPKIGKTGIMVYPLENYAKGTLFDSEKRLLSIKGLCHAIICRKQEKVFINENEQRFLTPKEKLQLMGFDKKDYITIKEAVVFKTKIAKLIGNSIVVPVVEEIVKELFKNEKNNDR